MPSALTINRLCGKEVQIMTTLGDILWGEIPAPDPNEGDTPPIDPQITYACLVICCGGTNPTSTAGTACR